MEYRAFGRTGLDVSAIGFGCWEMGGTYGPIEEKELMAAVGRALDVGINCFDTAEKYGDGTSESLLAKALGGRREEVILVTKFGVHYFEAEREKGRDSRAERAMAAIEGSLKRLGTDYLDVYLIHWPDPHTPFEETMRALDEIVSQGKARFVGVSNFRADEVSACMSTRRVDVAQYGYHLYDRRMERDVFPLCEAHGIGLMGYGSLAFGLLTGTMDGSTTFEKSDWRSGGGAFNLPLFSEENFGPNLRVADALKEIAERGGRALYHLALAWVLSHPAMSVALVGARRPEEVDANLGALEWSLSEEEMREIDAAFKANGVDPAPDIWLE